ncbi:MAG: hypothetical protein F6K11_10550 [Leptolyngbya sp. SIO3F4]|nr:hypothetical protein [Leptolyngbya sp. SIO3F4]
MNSTEFAQEVLRLTNEFRAEEGLSPLTMNEELTETAQNYSQTMAEDDFFSHTGEDGSTPWERAEAEGYTANAMGENLAAGQRTPAQVVQAWIDSAGHRENLLNPAFTEMGLGYFELQNDTGQVNFNRYWTQLFGSGDLMPDNSAPAPEPVPVEEPAPEPMAEQPVEELASEPVPEPVAEQPVEEPMPEPVQEPVPEPVAEQPVKEPMPEPVQEPVQEPVAEQPVEEPAPEPVQEPMPEPVQEPAEEPVQEPMAEQPVEEPAPEPVQEPVAEQPVEEPMPEPVQEPVAEQPIEKTAPEPIEEPMPEPVQEPVQEPMAEPVSEPVQEPMADVKQPAMDRLRTLEPAPRFIFVGNANKNNLKGNNLGNVMLGFAGNDRIKALKGNDFVSGGLGNDRLWGNLGDDMLMGDEGNDTLHGGHGSDKLVGGLDNDVLVGGGRSFFGPEIDTLTGDEGADKFVLGNKRKAFYINDGSADYALITDLTTAEGDTIQLSKQYSYSLGAAPEGTADGQGLFVDKNGVSELVAIIQSDSDLALTDSTFVTV